MANNYTKTVWTVDSGEKINALNLNKIEQGIFDKEDDLANPITDGFVLSSTSAGVRSWVEQSGGTSDDYYSGGDAETLYVGDVPYIVPNGFILTNYVETESYTGQLGYLDCTFSANGSRRLSLDGLSDYAHSWSLSTGWDIETLLDKKIFLLTSEDLTPEALMYSKDGDYLFMIGRSNFVYRYSLSTPFDVSTADYVTDSNSLNVSSSDTVCLSFFINLEGDELFVGGSTEDDIDRWTLSTPWDLTSATWVSTFTGLTTASPNGFYFSPNGLNFYVSNAWDGTKRFSMTVAWDITTAVLEEEVAFTTGWVNCPYISPDGRYLIVLSKDSGTLYKFEV